MDQEAPQTESVKAYRQALRDITKQNGFPYAVVWPEVAEEVIEEPV